jgi:hypothetical protein
MLLKPKRFNENAIDYNFTVTFLVLDLTTRLPYNSDENRLIHKDEINL